MIKDTTATNTKKSRAELRKIKTSPIIDYNAFLTSLSPCSKIRDDTTYGRCGGFFFCATDYITIGLSRVSYPYFRFYKAISSNIDVLKNQILDSICFMKELENLDRTIIKILINQAYNLPEKRVINLKNLPIRFK
ncbi:hypothetical protein BKH43_05915 [Helicobacter sp. 13S00401-1]|uniref:hypothetical protein n=1 Tax=Helicobacter sp. 13S00401-1 TaxID=1905758 RepID=UPI000BA5845A|nr:hypothetical protein [Helicobacter sp. 13S00401-1]PAF50143.1 hypothetical protein BKH43_05915 [Helicobacter sp. 13S00401-1]